MNLSEFFLVALNVGRLKDKTWILAAFSIVKNDQGWNPRPYTILYKEDDDGNLVDVLFHDDEANVIYLDDYKFDKKNPQPPYKFKDPIHLAKGDLPNVFKATATTYGNVVANWLWLVYPFNDKIEFITGKFGIQSHIEPILEKRLVSDPEDPETPRSKESIYVDEYLKFTKVKGLFDGLSQLCVPSADERTLTHHPDRDKVRKELQEKYKGQTQDPAIVAKIDKALVELDEEWVMGGESAGFFISGKQTKIARKKAYGQQGLEQAFHDVGVEPTYIPTALDDGWDRTKMPAIVNNLREGSFDRGFQTQLGGKGTKDILSLIQNSVISEDDCGSKLGIVETVTEKNKEEYIGNNFIIDGKVVRITEENINLVMNKPTTMRTAGYCKTKKGNFCKVCIGGRYENHPTGLATAGSSVTTKFMLLFMKRAHGTELKTTLYDPNKILS